MKLLSQIIRKKLDLYNEFMLRRYYIRALWNFYCVYNLSSAYLNYQEERNYSRKRQRVWNRFFNIFMTKKNDDNTFRMIQVFINKDMQIIIKALNQMEKSDEKSDGVVGDLYKHGTIGMLAYEFFSN